MFNFNQQNSKYNYINLQESSGNSISNQMFQSEFYFYYNDKKQRKFYLNKKYAQIQQMNKQSRNKQHLKQEEKSHFGFKNNIIIRRSQFSQQTKYKKKIKKNSKCKILGGGCGASKFQIQIPQQIIYSQKKGMLDEKFMQNYEYFTDKKKIVQNIEYERQGGMQVDIIQCLKLSNIHIRRNIIIYKPKLINLIDVYLIYVLSGSSQKEVLKENEIKELGSLLNEMRESFEMESLEQPSCDLIFYFDILSGFNSTRTGKDEQNKSQLMKAVELITTIVKLGAGVLKTIGGDYMKGIDMALQGAQYLLKSYQHPQANQLFSYLLDIWVRKTVQFQDRIWNLTLLEELEFYITIFNELCSKKNYETDLVLLTLIKIDYYFSLALDEESSLKIISQKLSLNCSLIKLFLPMLIQKSNVQSIFDEIQSFLKFTVQNHIYRFLTISILLKYNKIIQETNDFQGYKEYINIYLCYKYLCEKNKSVKLAFEISKQFVESFNLEIQSVEFQDKIIEVSKERSRDLKSLLDLEGYEEKIENSQDIERMVANILVDKWERDIKKRQQDNIAQKDDILLEVKDLYIQQSITYLIGNQILQPKLSQIQTNSENKQTQRSNAIQEILDNFLQGSIQNNPNINNSSTERQIKCKILGILAEGGTGKSMFMKKLETYLIQAANSNSETNNYIPLLIKCNSLDQISPSIEDYLLAQGVTQQQIKTLKGSNRNKVILLDGYDEFTGEYFRVYYQLKLSKWKNTKVIVTSRKEKLELVDACAKFSLDGDNGLKDDSSYCIVKLKEFNHEDILEYCKIYFRQFRTQEEQFDEFQFQNDMEVMIDFMKNRSLQTLLYLPINLYLFTRMIVQMKDKTEIQKIKENISDQIGIQEIFLKEQFKREAQDFLQTQVQVSSKKNNDISELIINSFFEYFQNISIKMFLNKGKPQITNFLQIRKDKIEYRLSKQIENKLSEKEKKSLLEKIIHYVNSKIITRSKEVINIDSKNKEQNKNYLIEFKHKSLFEYFVARAMKYDFDIHQDNIYKLSIEQLKEFNINKKNIMNAGKNQSEQQVLIKLYKMIKNEIESDEFYSTYHLNQIENNSRYIQYVKKSTIKKNTEISQIDIGASNILSALFISRFIYSYLEFNLCSFSKLYSTGQKSDSINFNQCNLQNGYLKNLNINYDSCNIQFATFENYQKVYDTQNTFSFKSVVWSNNSNIQYSITLTGFINAFKIENQNVQLEKSKQLSYSQLSQILIVNNDTLLVSSQYSLLLINSSSFDLLESYKFKNEISCMTLIKENILVTLKNETIFYGSFKIGFRKMNIIGSGCIYNLQKQILLIYTDCNFSLYNTEENFKLINTIYGHSSQINSGAFSTDGKYLATGSADCSCKIWNVEKKFELVYTISDHIDQIYSVVFSVNGKYLVTGSLDNTCKVWNIEKSFELINTIQNIDQICSMAFSQEGTYLSVGSTNNGCKIYNTEKSFELTNTIQGHISAINSVSFSSDGKYLATGSEDKTCKIWDVEKRFKLINTIQGHADIIFSVSFSPDRKYLATGSRDKTCKIWNLQKDFELINTIQGHTDSINSVTFSADGKYLATGSGDCSCKIWNAEKGFELINTINGHASAINSVVFSTDGKYLATGSSDSTCKLWNPEKGFELIKIVEDRIKGHTSDIYSIAFSPDGKYLATGSRDSACIIWSVEKSFKLINKIENQNLVFIFSISFSLDGKYLSITGWDKTCKVLNVEKGFELINTIEGHTDSISSAAFSADSKYLVTGSKDNSFKIWNTDNDFEIINKIQSHDGKIHSVTFSADGKYLATGSEDCSCKIWNAQKGFELINTLKGHNFVVQSLSFSAGTKYLATGSWDNTCKIWNVEKGFELIKTVTDHTLGITSVAFSSDEKYLVTSSADKTCKLFNSEKNFEFIKTILSHTSQIFSVSFSSQGKYLAAGSQDGTCKIWNIEKGFELINTIQGHTELIYFIAFSADGKYLATGSDDKTCKIWNAEKGFELINKIEYNANIRSIAFSTDRKYLATTSVDETCQIWNVEKGFELIATILDKSQSYILQTAFSPDGKYLATGTADNTCKIWNVEKGFELINKIQGLTSAINSVAFSEDGKYICVKQNDKSCNIYDLQNTQLMSEKQNNYEQLQDKYKFEQNENNQLNKMKLFQNMYIL